jgi:hypothetical protein
MNENDSNSNVSRRTMVELLAGCSGYAMAVGPAMAFGAVAANPCAAVESSAALIRQLVNRLDGRLLQGIAVSQLSLIESDYFGRTCRDRPQDFWECIETWPMEAKQGAVDLLLPMIAANEPSFT